MSVGLPSWQELIRRIGSELEVDCAQLPYTSHHTLAEYYRIKHGSIGPLRSWMDRHWKVSPEKVRMSKLHETIVALDFPVIYTTNYDRNLEEAFAAHGREFVKVANARDVAKTRDGVTQIVKFHGDFDDDTSLVITETDYFNRLAFDSPLDIKLRADALARTVLFVGYSMSDLNIRLLFHNLWRTWQASGYERERPSSYVFMPQKDPMQTAVLNEWGLTVLSGGNGDPEAALAAFLHELVLRVQALRDAHRFGRPRVDQRSKSNERKREMTRNAPRQDQRSPQSAAGDVRRNPGDEAVRGTPGTGEDVCPVCAGKGRREGAPCPNCGGTGKIVRAIGGA